MSEITDVEIAVQIRKLLNAYPLGTMDWPLDVMTNAADALERRASSPAAGRDAVIEECAKVCDELQKLTAAGAGNVAAQGPADRAATNYVNAGILAGMSDAASDCAQAIRALKETPNGN